MADTVPTYAIPQDVMNLLLLEGFLDANSQPPEGIIDDLLVRCEGEFEERTGQSYRPVLVTDEVWDLEAHIARYPDIFQLTFGRWGIKLLHTNLVPFSAARNHKIEIYSGNEPWEDFVADKTEGRNRDYWVDYSKGIIWIRKPFAMYHNSSVRVTYEHGRQHPTLSVAMDADDTTMTLSSTDGLQNQGIVRVGYEYIQYGARTSTQLTGCRRAKLNTIAEAHDSGDSVVQVPGHIRSLIAKRAAATLLENEPFMAIIGGGADGEAVSERISRWHGDWEREIGGTYQKWEVF